MVSILKMRRKRDWEKGDSFSKKLFDQFLQVLKNNMFPVGLQA